MHFIEILNEVERRIFFKFHQATVMIIVDNVGGVIYFIRSCRYSKCLPSLCIVWGKVIFLHLSVILFTGEGLPHTTPREQTPPLRSACWEIRSTSGRYASYWNAILFYLVLAVFRWPVAFYNIIVEGKIRVFFSGSNFTSFLLVNRITEAGFPLVPGWQNSLTFPWLFSIFFSIFQYFFNVLFFLTENFIHFSK